MAGADITFALTEKCARYGRPVSDWTDDGDGNLSPVFVPPLTPTEQAIFDDISRMARFGVDVSLAEWQAIKEDAAGLKQYLGVTSPTAAQTAAATKAIIRVLATIIRD